MPETLHVGEGRHITLPLFFLMADPWCEWGAGFSYSASIILDFGATKGPNRRIQGVAFTTAKLAAEFLEATPPAHRSGIKLLGAFESNFAGAARFALHRDNNLQDWRYDTAIEDAAFAIRVTPQQ